MQYKFILKKSLSETSDEVAKQNKSIRFRFLNFLRVEGASNLAYSGEKSVICFLFFRVGDNFVWLYLRVFYKWQNCFGLYCLASLFKQAFVDFIYFMEKIISNCFSQTKPPPRYFFSNWHYCQTKNSENFSLRSWILFKNFKDLSLYLGFFLDFLYSRASTLICFFFWILIETSQDCTTKGYLNLVNGNWVSRKILCKSSSLWRQKESWQWNGIFRDKKSQAELFWKVQKILWSQGYK